MSNGSWYFAANGQQQGPYPDAQFRDLIARGTVNSQTLVWREGMAGWQKAAEVPGLLSAGMAPPAFPPGGGAAVGAGGYGASSGGYAGNGALSVDFGIWDFTWRSVLFVIGMLFVIPGPWVLVWYLKWAVPCVHVPGRPNLSFTGTVGTIAKWFFGGIALIILLSVIAGVTGISSIGNLGGVVQVVLYWLFLKYLVANLASNDQPLGLSFSGSFWAYLGWTILTLVSFITIIGWAWVFAAQMRWVCRNIQGTRRAIVFKGTGLQFLWRLIVVAIASGFIIPIPWVYRWMLQWQSSQTELVDRGAYANG
jgi:GYF domain 2